MKINLEVIGDEELATNFRNVAFIQRQLNEAGTKTGVEVQKRASTAPPARSSSNYRRTRRLENSWDMKVQPIGGGVRSIVDNPTDYGPYVMGTQDQAAVHRGRWPTEHKILVELRQKALGFYDFALGQIKRYIER